MFGKFLDPKNDLAFKRIFGSEKNKDILIHFLNDLFATTINPIEEVTFLKTASDPETAAQRTSIVDILCHDAHGDYFIVEMQVNWEPRFEKRAQYYAAKTYIQQRDRGVDYHDLKQVTFLAITNYTLFPDDEEYLSHHHVLNTKSHERQLKDLSFSFLELSKFKKSKKKLSSMVEKWAYFLKYAPETREEDLKEIIGSDLIIQRAYDELNRFAWSPEELRGYDSFDMKQSADRACYEGALARGEAKGTVKGMKKGIKIGRAEGAHQEKLRIAEQLIKKGFDPNEIEVMTGLTTEEVVRLIENAKTDPICPSS